jgi:hypothetical protein
MARSFLLGAVGLITLATAAFAACSASITPGSGGAGGSGSSTSGDGASSSESASSSASASSTDGAGGFTTSSGAGGSGGGCAGKALMAMPVPLDIFVMLDQSGSMSTDAGNGMSRWQTVKSALTSFTQQPSTAGIGLGLQYFGLPDPSVLGCTTMPCALDSDCTNGCTTCGPGGVCHSPYNPDIDTCVAGEYAWAEVPIAPLPGVAGAIFSSLGMHAPGTNTPTAPALEGAIDYAKAWAVAHPTHITFVAFATDGLPSECDTDPNTLHTIAAAGVAGTPSIKTFVIGVGPALQQLDDIAAAGGTTTAFHVDMSPTAEQAFVDAMNTIRGAGLACTFQIPPAAPGMMEDFSLVNVDYTPGNGGMKHTIPNVKGKAQCPAQGEGWYYDSDAKPTEIILCDATCAVVSKDALGEVDIEVGCQTISK